MSAATALLATTPLVRAAEEEFDPNTVTPGVWGFVITFGIMVVVTLLVIDMTRRIRRTNYRAEVREELAREMAVAEAEAAAAAGLEDEATDASAQEPDVTGADPAASDGDENPPR